MNLSITTLVAAVVGCCPLMAHAAPTTLESPVVRTNFETLTVHVPYDADDGGDVRARLEIRPSGAEDWREAHHLSRTLLGGQPRLSGVAVGLSPGTEYDLRITAEDPDGVDGDPVLLTVARTRDDAVPTGSGDTIHVDPGGDDGAGGSPAAPLRTIQAAVDRAGPGDVVLVHAGTYREAVLVASGGEPDAYLAVVGEPGAVLDGSNPDIGAQGWTLHSRVAGGLTVYRRDVPIGTVATFASVDGRRVYPYETLPELETMAADQASAEEVTAGYYGTSVGGFFLDAAAGVAYLLTPEGDDPASHAVAVNSLSSGITVAATSHVVIEGLEIRNYGPSGESGTSRGVEVVDASDVIVRDNRISGVTWGIRARKSERVLIEDNAVEASLGYALAWGGDYGAYTGPAHDQGISIQGSYEDHVVRRNVVRGFVDGIVVSTGSGSRCENFDIHHNLVSESRDDAIELDCDDVGGKAFRNTVHENHSAFSISGADVGPLFVFANQISRYSNESFKLHPREVQGPVFIYHNTAVSAWPDLPGDVGRGLEIEMLASMTYASEAYLTFANNIFVGSEWVRVDSGVAPDPSAYVFDHDCWYSSHPEQFFSLAGTEYVDLSTYSLATGMETNGVEGDPRFVDAASFDYHLREDSPCRDAGVVIPGINDGFDGVAPDMGAFFDQEDPEPEEPGGTGGGSGGGSTSGHGSSGSGGEGSADGAEDATGSGCGCRGGARTGWATLLFVLVSLRRRRSAPAIAVP